MNQETQEKITQLQNIEQNINNLIAQKQQFQSQNIEADNALSQLESTEKVFRIIGSIMVASDKEKVKKELNEKKEITELRLKTIDKQEEKMRKKAEELQHDVLSDMKKE
jgi:prefoldin beta subunit